MEYGPQTNTIEQQPTRERLKIFDELASVRMLRYDLDTFGRVLPETMQQAYNEELSYVAESINAPLKTKFTLRHTPEGLVDDCGRSLHKTLQRGQQAAEEAAWGDSRLWFNAKRAVHDFHEGELLASMMNGDTSANTIVSVSPFCEEAYRSYGKACVENLGFQLERKLAFIRIYTKTADNQLEVASVSVDNSDLEAFSTVLSQLGVAVPPDTRSDDYLAYRAQLSLDSTAQEVLPERLLSTYDQAMKRLYGQEFAAGRPKADEVESWSFVASQKDLVEHYFDRLEQLAQTNPHDAVAKRELTYSFWAALKDRLKAAGVDKLLETPTPHDNPHMQFQQLEYEMKRALHRATIRHEQMVACGGSIGTTDKLTDMSPDDAMTEIMGDKKETKLIWKEGICRIEGCPTRPSKTKVAQCNICQKCQAVFDDGRNPAEEYARSKKTDKGHHS